MKVSDIYKEISKDLEHYPTSSEAIAQMVLAQVILISTEDVSNAIREASKEISISMENL